MLLATKTSQMRFRRVILYLFCAIGFMNSKFETVYHEKSSIFLNTFFFHIFHFGVTLRIILANIFKEIQSIFILTLARGNGCGQICGYSTILGQPGRCLRSFLAAFTVWLAVFIDGWLLVMVGKWQAKNVSLWLYIFLGCYWDSP